MSNRFLLSAPERSDDTIPERVANRRGVRPSDDPVRVMLVDDQHLMRHAIKAMLSAESALLVVGDAADPEESLRAIHSCGPQVVVISADLPEDGCLRTLRELDSIVDGPRALVLGNGDNAELTLAAFRAGALGFVPRTAKLRELREAIEAVANGTSYVLPSTAKVLALGLRGAATPPTPSNRKPSRVALDKLSDRERTVFGLVAQGFSGPEIAERLGITAKTVDTYRHRVFEKTGVHHRAEYVQVALDAGILRPSSEAPSRIA